MVNRQEPIAVLIVEDHQVVADGLAMLLEDDPHIRVVGAVATGSEAIEMAELHQPDVVLMDFRLPDQTGAEAAGMIKGDRPETAVLFLSADDNEDAVLAAVKAGACGYLVKTEAAPRLLDAIHRAAAGEMLIPAWQLAKLLARKDPGDENLPGSELTSRQKEVLELMAEGLGTKAIAERLQLQPSTAAWHVQSVLEKLDAHSKLEAVARATQRGILER
jgi:DNA-binding NarL/FixJ family response regulator